MNLIYHLHGGFLCQKQAFRVILATALFCFPSLPLSSSAASSLAEDIFLEILVDFWPALKVTLSLFNRK